MARVSIIIPVYNVESYLKQSLDSVVSQTLDDIEIICVDDCSTDSSVEILREYAQKDNRIKIHLQKENQGQGVARNVALEMATGDYVMFLDPDDWLDKYACEIAYNQIKNNNNDIVCFNYNFYKETENVIIIKKSQHLNIFKEYSDKGFYLKDVEGLIFNAATVWSQIYNRKFLNRINAKFSETRTCEDNPFYFNAMCKAQTISIIPKELYYYRIRINNEQPYYINHWKDVFYNKNLAYEIVKNSQYREQLLKAYIPYYWGSLVNGHISRVINHNKSFRKDIYIELHNLARKLNKEYPMKTLASDFDYENYKISFLANNVLSRKVFKLLFKIFSIGLNKKYIILKILGFKIKIKKEK